MGKGSNLKHASHRQRAGRSNLKYQERNIHVQGAHQRVGNEQPNVRPAANNQEEEKKAVESQQLRSAAIQAVGAQV